VSDERTLEEQCYGVCWAAKERIEELEAGIAHRLGHLYAVNAELLEALHHISLASQNSMSSIEECGRIARAAIAKATEVKP
jgi:hypothetical protein